MALKLDELCAQLGTRKGHPPVEKWHPDLSGDIDIVIDEQGRWFHENTLIERFELVKLFASILRYEEGLGYCLVTPVEKWLLTVKDVPFLIKRYDLVDAEQDNPSQQQSLAFISNVDDLKLLESADDWQLREFQGVMVPYVRMRAELWARLSRSVYYALLEQFEPQQGPEGLGIRQGDVFLPLEP